jgi:hypothetical protein
MKNIAEADYDLLRIAKSHWEGFLKKALFCVTAVTAFTIVYVSPEYSMGLYFDMAGAYADGVSQTQKNIDAFRKAGWDVYTSKEARQELNQAYRNKWHYISLSKDVASAWEDNTLNIQDHLSDIKLDVPLLFDGEKSNDEIKAIIVSDDNYLLINIYSGDKTIGEDYKKKKLYAIGKHVDKLTADLFRSISHAY